MYLHQILRELELLAPPALQESYDNAGLITGNRDSDITGALVCLDCTEAIVEEAMQKGCNLIVAHHPIVFGGLKKITGRNYVERVIIKAIKNDIAIYAIHTNLDNVSEGVNAKIAERLGLTNTRILAPKEGLLRKLTTFAPTDHAERVRSALFSAGAGAIGHYDECSFNISGEGTFRASHKASPFVGETGARHREPEIRIEVIFEAWKEAAVLKALRADHPYEEVAYYLNDLRNAHQDTGAGMIGELPAAISPEEFIKQLKISMKADCVRATKLPSKPIRKVAVCGGSGSFLLNDAIRAGADVFVSADFKYHQFFDADGRILILDIGHFETEQFTIDLLGAFLTEKFPTFAVRLTETSTNPISYF